MDDVRGRFLGLPHGTTPAAVTTNKNIKMSSFKSSENIQKKEGGPDRSVSDNQSSSVTLNELAMKARKDTVISSFSKELLSLRLRRAKNYKATFCIVLPFTASFFGSEIPPNRTNFQRFFFALFFLQSGKTV